MKYETLSEYKTGSWSTTNEITFTFTYINNISYIVTLLLNQYTYGWIGSEVGSITSYSISDNILTVIVKCKQESISGVNYELFLLATVASY